MNQAKASHPKRNKREGFTLVELLVVIAIIALLAALLLPNLARAKDSAKSASCKNNLRQLGIALEMYVTDYGKYPGSGAIYSDRVFQGIWGTGLDWLNPYLARNRDSNSRLHFQRPGPDILNCPARSPRSIPSPFGGGAKVYILSYGYNELGTSRKDDFLHLGMGFKISAIGLGLNPGFDLPQGERVYISPSQIVNPSDMITMADTAGSNWLSPPSANSENGSLQGPHGEDSANVLFADGHVVAGKSWVWNQASEPARKRWNNDNLPHPETWQ